MKEFVSSALPWVLAGLALAILAVNHAVEPQKNRARGSRIATGAGLGLLLGVALNGCGLWEEHALGLALGPLWGMALATLFPGETAPEDGEDSDNG